jgi:hypothetical protein
MDFGGHGNKIQMNRIAKDKVYEHGAAHLHGDGAL